MFIKRILHEFHPSLENATDSKKTLYRRTSLYTVLLSANSHLQSNLCITTTLGTQILWPSLTGGRYSEVVVNSGLTVCACETDRNYLYIFLHVTCIWKTSACNEKCLLLNKYCFTFQPKKQILISKFILLRMTRFIPQAIFN
jgi:hypothetical protein